MWVSKISVKEVQKGKRRNLVSFGIWVNQDHNSSTQERQFENVLSSVIQILNIFYKSYTSHMHVVYMKHNIHSRTHIFINVMGHRQKFPTNHQLKGRFVPQAMAKLFVVPQT